MAKNRWHLTTQEMADLFDVTTRSIQAWGTNGCPKIRRGVWDLKASLPWIMEHLYGGNGAAETTGELYQAKVEYWQGKAKLTAIAAEKAADAVLPKADVLTAWVERIIAVCSGLEALADRLPPLLAGLTPRTMQPIIKAEVRTLREGFANSGRYCPTPPGLEKLIDDYYQGAGADGK